jgi:hypothetical protein
MRIASSKTSVISTQYSRLCSGHSAIWHGQKTQMLPALIQAATA